MKWSLKNKRDLKNIEKLGFDKFVLNLSLTLHTPNPKDTWDNYDTQYLEVVILGIPSHARIKQELLNLLRLYDTSEEVNSFTINGITTWLDRNTRIALKNSLDVMEANGATTYSVWLNKLNLTLPISTIKNFLNTLEVYAILAFNVTLEHIAQIEEITNTQELFTFDVSAGYPQKIDITISL